MRVWDRLRAEWQLKLLLSGVVNLLFWSAYSYLGRHAVFPLRTIPLTWLDSNIPYRPEPWAWIYLSQFLFTGGVPWLLTTRDEIRRYVTGLSILSGISFAIFLFFPVASPRPDGEDSVGAMKIIIGYDGALNAFPSLHAGFMVFMAALVWRRFNQRITPLAACIGVAWCLAILYATIATKQHYALDLVAGALIGVFADYLAWRGVARTAAVATTLRKSGVTSQLGCK